MNLSELIPLLRCVECESPVAADGDRIVCQRCATTWTTVNGVYDLRPTASLPLPMMYGDQNYQQWNRRLAAAQDYFYHSNALVAWVQNAGHRAIRAMTSASPAALTLDMACGDGGHRPYMWRGDRVVGVDIDQGSLETHRRRYPEAIVVRGDCYRLPFADGAFERVINVYNLEHLIHLDFALEEAKRVMAAAGEFLVSVPTEGGIAWTLGRRMTTARNFTSEGLDYLRANAIDHCNCVWQVEKALRRHFRIVNRRLFPVSLPLYHVNLIATWSLRP
jgi:phosphatidylethanolamine/phosphatidyl-N-methylethanolamine N-methyltransferase